MSPAKAGLLPLPQGPTPCASLLAARVPLPQSSDIRTDDPSLCTQTHNEPMGMHTHAHPRSGFLGPTGSSGPQCLWPQSLERLLLCRDPARPQMARALNRRAHPAAPPSGPGHPRASGWTRGQHHTSSALADEAEVWVSAGSHRGDPESMETKLRLSGRCPPDPRWGSLCSQGDGVAGGRAKGLGDDLGRSLDVPRASAA